MKKQGDDRSRLLRTSSISCRRAAGFIDGGDLSHYLALELPSEAVAIAY